MQSSVLRVLCLDYSRWYCSKHWSSKRVCWILDNWLLWLRCPCPTLAWLGLSDPVVTYKLKRFLLYGLHTLGWGRVLHQGPLLIWLHGVSSLPSKDRWRPSTLRTNGRLPKTTNFVLSGSSKSLLVKVHWHILCRDSFILLCLPDLLALFCGQVRCQLVVSSSFTNVR